MGLTPEQQMKRLADMGINVAGGVTAGRNIVEGDQFKKGGVDVTDKISDGEKQQIKEAVRGMKKGVEEPRPETVVEEKPGSYTSQGDFVGGKIRTIRN